jgi:hypothetical protein
MVKLANQWIKYIILLKFFISSLYESLESLLTARILDSPFPGYFNSFFFTIEHCAVLHALHQEDS